MHYILAVLVKNKRIDIYFTGNTISYFEFCGIVENKIKARLPKNVGSKLNKSCNTASSPTDELIKCSIKHTTIYIKHSLMQNLQKMNV